MKDSQQPCEHKLSSKSSILGMEHLLEVFSEGSFWHLRLAGIFLQVYLSHMIHFFNKLMFNRLI